MSERMYGPSTMPCPEHGDQGVVAISFQYARTACGAYVEDDHWFHVVTVEEKDAATIRLAKLVAEHAVEDPDFMGCCPEDDAYWDRMTLKFAPPEIQAEAVLLEATIAAHWRLAGM